MLLCSTIRASTILSRRIALSRNFTTKLASMQPVNTKNTTQTNVINSKHDNLSNIPIELLYTSHPKPIRHEIIESKEPLKTKDLENLDIKLTLHREPATISDKIAFGIVKLLRLPTDWFFKKKYIHRVVMLETIAAVPGLVGGTIRHLKSLRKLKHDGGWIEHLLHEAENERQAIH
ncbi:11258_t:CDS:2 [Entrophospora sp. SA101]|nr:11258_t:CDS:2 [Entrophospora sp. SA101]